MATKTRAALKSDISQNITSNGLQAISGPILRVELDHIADSCYNLLSDSPTTLPLTPISGLTATNIQDAISEIQADKASLTNTNIFDGINRFNNDIGFYSANPVPKPAAYTNSSGIVADKVLNVYTANPQSSAYVSSSSDVNLKADLADINSLRTAYENLRVFTEDLAAFVIAMLIDDQTIGLK